MRNQTVFKKVDQYTRIKEVKGLNIYPFYKELFSAIDTEVIITGHQKVLMLGSNSYTGLTTHPEVKEAAINAIRKYGTGCSGSRILNGTLDIHIELERALADFVGKEDVIIYPTGYSANVGVLSALMTRHDHFFMDDLNHASLIDGALLSRAHIHKYEHNNMESLKRLFEKHKDTENLIAVDGVFSMDGDIAKLPEIVNFAEKYNTVVVVDEAHAIGVIGKDGSGTASHFGLTDKIDIIMGTFSKSLASVGGFIASDATIIEFLKHWSRSLLFSASLPPACIASALAALEIIKENPTIRDSLWRNTRQMQDGLIAAGFNIGNSETPIIPIIIGPDEKAYIMTKLLLENGIFVNPVVSPAVPKNCSLIRISLMATHTETQIAYAIEKLTKTAQSLGII
ncbi:MAG: aminotransferase class I/II-fold pyridoxal phosphate-dependent enzyme [Lentisphaerota bacterium]